VTPRLLFGEPQHPRELYYVKRLLLWTHSPSRPGAATYWRFCVYAQPIHMHAEPSTRRSGPEFSDHAPIIATFKADPPRE
jgi:hypothetical protein